MHGARWQRTGLPVQEERLGSLPMRSAGVRTSKSGYSAGRCFEFVAFGVLT